VSDLLIRVLVFPVFCIICNVLFRLCIFILIYFILYLGYCISEYKSDLEDKLQTYNKINGTIRRHFGKQMTKETKLRIHNITAKAALRFGSEVLVLKKKKRQTTFRSSTDEIFETLTGNYEIR